MDLYKKKFLMIFLGLNSHIVGNILTFHNVRMDQEINGDKSQD